MKKLTIIILFSSISYLSIGQQTNDKVFYYNHFKIDSSQFPITNNKQYKVFGNHDNILNKPFTLLLLFYKSVLSEQLSSDCAFSPSCSSFSFKAIQEFGFIKGLFLTADRLTRCNGNANLDSAPHLIDNNKNAKVNDIPSFYRSSK